MDMSLLTGAVASLRAAGDMTKGMVALRDLNMLNEKAIELQNEIISAQQKILAAQEEQLRMVNKITELEVKIKSYENWSEEKTKYETTDISREVVVYRKIDDNQNNPILYCPVCFSNGKNIHSSPGNLESGSV